VGVLGEQGRPRAVRTPYAGWRATVARERLTSIPRLVLGIIVVGLPLELWLFDASLAEAIWTVAIASAITAFAVLLIERFRSARANRAD
jgi:undecaprenyl pyrophosphate phosphatase UppP